MASLDLVLLATDKVANPLLVQLLRSPAGRRLGRRLAVVEYVGRRTGKRHRLVTQYTCDGETVRIAVGRPDQKTWWRNFRQPRPLRLRLAGVDREATAHLVVGRAGREEGLLVEASLASHALG